MALKHIKDLPEKAQKEFATLTQSHLRLQYWSDGLVVFVKLKEPENRCTANDVMNMFGLAGSECLEGLASGAPIRGAIDVAWGTELRANELYGAVIANAYEQESCYAHHPRVLVSDLTIDFLLAQMQRPQTGTAALLNKALAENCLQMIGRDADGRHTLHYLGKTFAETFYSGGYDELYHAAKEFSFKEYQRFESSGNTKLAPRYKTLLAYFVQFPPGSP